MKSIVSKSFSSLRVLLIRKDSKLNKNSESERLESVNKRMIDKSKEDQKIVNFLETSVDKTRMPVMLRK